MGVVLDAATQVAAGMEYLHAQGVLHGDLCPKNVLLAQLPERAQLTRQQQGSGLGQGVVEPGAAALLPGSALGAIAKVSMRRSLSQRQGYHHVLQPRNPAAVCPKQLEVALAHQWGLCSKVARPTLYPDPSHVSYRVYSNTHAHVCMHVL